MKKLLALMAVLMLIGGLFCSCAKASENAPEADAEEEIEYQTLSVDDEEYYTKFKDKDISINVYNIHEHIYSLGGYIKKH